MGRDVGRCRNVVNYMLTYATKDQKVFLLSKPPSIEKVGEDWTLWSNKLQEIDRSITVVTMKELAAVDAKLFGDKKAKSKAGAKVTATISAVDKRLTTLKSARDKSNPKSVMLSFTVASSTNLMEAPPNLVKGPMSTSSSSSSSASFSATHCAVQESSSSSASSSATHCAAQESPATPSRALKRQRKQSNKDEISVTV